MKVYYNNFVVTRFSGFNRGIGQSFVHTLKNMPQIEKFMLNPLKENPLLEEDFFEFFSPDSFPVYKGWASIEDFNKCQHECLIDKFFPGGLIHSWDNVPLETKYPQVVTVHDIFWISRKYRKYYTDVVFDEFAMKDRFLKYVDCVISPSNYSRRDYSLWMEMYHGMTEVIPWGSKYPSVKNITADCLKEYILLVGYPEPRKNFGAFFKAYTSLNRNIKIIWVIGQPLSRELRQEVAWSCVGLPIQVFENITDEALKGFYDDAICLVMPSLFEGFGMPVVEAASRGCPVMSTNFSSLEDFSGFTHVANTPEDMAVGLVKLIEHKDYRVELAGKGLIAVHDKFNFEKTAKEYIEVYNHYGN